MRIKLIPSVILVTMLAILAFPQKTQIANQLTKAEKNAGWLLLFDGKSFNGWRGFHSDKVPGGWVIEDGAIKKISAKGELGQAGGDLITAAEFSNFELQLEWKLSPGGNSGIKYLVTESQPPSGKSAISFEYQVLDDDKHPDAKAGIDGNRTSGSLYDLIPSAKTRKLKPIGEFNEVRIIVRGNHIEHWLNGVKVVEFDRSSADFKERLAKSKFKNIKGFGEATKGHILLQDHGNAVWYRNIKIRNL
jgi:3-keto-disaccharide hydrolase